MEKRHRRKTLSYADKYLIQLVSTHKFMYEWNHKDYKDDNLRKLFFQWCAGELKKKYPSLYCQAVDVLGPLVKLEWYGLRDLYRRASARFQTTKKLSELMEEAYYEMSFLQEWIVIKESRKSNPCEDQESDSEFGEENEVSVLPASDLFCKSIVEPAEKEDAVSDMGERDLVDEELSQAGKSTVSSMDDLSEEEDAVFQFVKRESLEIMNQKQFSHVKNDSASSSELSEFDKFVMKKAKTNTTMLPKNTVEYAMKESLSGSKEANFDDSIENLTDKDPDPNWTFDDFEHGTQNTNSHDTTKESTKSFKNVKEIFDKNFDKHPQMKPGNTETMDKLVNQLTEQTKQAEKLELIRDTVNLLTDILMKLPVNQYLLALDIIDNIFDKYLNL